MTAGIGIGLAFVAMLCWGFGDFLIQKSTRKVGDIEALFFVTAFGALVLLPFVYKNIGTLITSSWTILFILGVLCVTLLIAALFDFEALRVGKLAIVEPIWSFEVPIAALLAFFILGERVTWIQIMLIVALLVGLALVSLRKEFYLKHFWLERGTLLAFLGAVFMGAANFFMGWGARVTDPIMANFITDVFIAVATGALLLKRGNIREAVRDMRLNGNVLLRMSISDKTAWVAFAFAMTIAPIGVVVALSESYIIVAVILGLLVNRERIQAHQKVGLFLALASALTLASITV